MSQPKPKHFVHILLGLSWGDEGKGKVIVDLLRKALGVAYVACVRFNGGCNAGHSVWINGVRFVTHQVPTGILVRGVKNLIAKGVKVNLVKLVAEIRELLGLGIEISKANLFVDPAAHIVLPTHILMDKLEDEKYGKLVIGTTKNGMMPIAVSKMARRSVRIIDLLENNGLAETVTQEHIDYIDKVYRVLSPEERVTILRELAELRLALAELAQYVTLGVNSRAFVMDALKKGDVLAESAQGYLLDVDHGTYPYVTSSNSGVGAFIDGTNVPYYTVSRVFGVAKMWYVTRVGEGPFPTELEPAAKGHYTEAHGLPWVIQNAGEKEEGSEKGATTGRPRRIGFVDFPAIYHASLSIGITDLILTKADRPGPLGDGTVLKACWDYDERGPLSPDIDYVLLMKTARPYLRPLDFEPAQRDVVFGEQPNAVQRMVRHMRTVSGADIPFMSVGPEPGQIVYIDHHPPRIGALLANGMDDRRAHH
jgi:adenylosuccinate synthase